MSINFILVNVYLKSGLGDTESLCNYINNLGKLESILEDFRETILFLHI